MLVVQALDHTLSHADSQRLSRELPMSFTKIVACFSTSTGPCGCSLNLCQIHLLRALVAQAWSVAGHVATYRPQNRREEHPAWPCGKSRYREIKESRDASLRLFVPLAWTMSALRFGCGEGLKLSAIIATSSRSRPCSKGKVQTPCIVVS